MMNMRKLIFVLVLFLPVQVFAQQLPLYSQYLYNKFLINPAHAGSDGFTSFNMTARNQWAGYAGSPKTFSLSGQVRVLKKGYRLRMNHRMINTQYIPKSDGRLGFGGYIFNDRHGLVHRTGLQLTYSYHTWLEDYTQLSFGLALNGYHLIIKADEYSFEEMDEPWLNNNLRKGVFVTDADFGVYLLNPHYDIGLSSQQLFGSAARVGEYAYRNFKMYRHYYLFGSYNFQVHVRTELQPSLMLKMSDLLKPQADIGFNYIYDQSIFAGVAYRTGGALVANLRARVIPSEVDMVSMFFGYAYDFSLNRMQKATFGSHEVMIALKFGSTSKRFRWIERL